MNKKKAITLIANTLFFIGGICGVVFGLHYLALTSILVMSLLFIWSQEISKQNENIIDVQEKNSDVDGIDSRSELYEQLQTRIEELTQENFRLEADLKEANQKAEQIPVVKENPQYLCALIGSLPIDLNTYISNIVNTYRKEFDTKGVYFDYNCSEADNNTDTYLSESALNIISNNVFDNILKFTSRGDRVFVILSKLDDDNLIIFKNSGEGVRENELDRIFELNFQGSNHKNGNGLGLAQVKAIIDDFGGFAWVKSTSSSGFTLYLQIPKGGRQ
jgi:light-regulated signal transduction histidine kinase (bacteriophytochrome)